MMKLLIPFALTTAVLAAGHGANARPYEQMQAEQNTVIRQASINTNFGAIKSQPKINKDAKIGIARLDKGRLIAAPIGELRDWAFLDNRSEFSFAPISPAAHIKTLPEIPMDGRDSDNRIDEIRLTAVTQGMDYVLIYGMNQDAGFGKFGHNPLAETGLVYSKNDEVLVKAAPAKAVLVNSFTGQVYGAINSSEVEFGVGDLTEKLENLLNSLNQTDDKKV